VACGADRRACESCGGWGVEPGMGVGGGGGQAAVSAPAPVPAEEAGKDAEEGGGWTVKAKLIAAAVLVWVLGSAALWVFLHSYFRHAALRKAEEALVSMCEERARMLQDQFAVSVNHVHALAILVATFHYEKHPPALDQVHLPPSLPPSPS
jgi:arabidopsis histidine kinase 2/3/4 (cytokinin receptor)